MTEGIHPAAAPNAFPLPAEGLVPHAPPLRFVDRLLSCDVSGGRAETRLRPGHPLLSGSGELEGAALVELLAQAYAAIKGYRDSLSGKPPQKGFLVGVPRMEFFATARAGDRLVVALREVGAVGEFFQAEGDVLRGDLLLATGSLRLWCPQ